MSWDAGYAEARQRWSWKRQVMNDNNTKILSPLKVQTQNGCSFSALAATLEPNLRVQWERDVTLSTVHLEKLNVDSSIVLPNERGKMMRLVLMVMNQGVFEEQQYREIEKGERREGGARKYRITRFTAYRMKDHEEIRKALLQLRRGGPLLAVIRISRNYDKCYNTGIMYRYDKSAVVEKNGEPQTHAVAVVSFGIEAKVPFLECQDSQGKRFGKEGFLTVDLNAVKELYSFRVRLSTD